MFGVLEAHDFAQFIVEFDANGDGAVNFDESCVMLRTSYRASRVSCCVQAAALEVRFASLQLYSYAQTATFAASTRLASAQNDNVAACGLCFGC